MKIDSKKLKNSIDSIEIDTHWFRRVFHTFAASFLIYYYIPDNFLLRFIIPSAIVLIIFIFELLRLHKKIDKNYFYGLKIYETNRPASYLYFGVAAYILLILFPQQIAIPCILCGCFTDPIIGEIRNLFGKNISYIIAFF
ncbi:MAG: dolichol kinase, partial [Candidatus Lokiarchaeota archaeon]|nr:dolichol kinase [Candidatus Lokiarchaeota archaeon]